jgi:ABC-type transport system substrate-binding protein
MKHNSCLALLFIVIGGVVGLVHGATVQPRFLDELRVAWHVTIAPDWFDPAETPAQITPFGILYALHDAVMRPLPGQRMAPALAASWTESPDGLTYEFKLRQGLRFHNGEPCTAEDVQYSFTRYKGTGAKELQAKVQRVEVVDPLTVRFHLHAPWPDFLTFYGTTATAAGLVVPKKYLEQVGEDGFKQFPVGLGPYKFLSATPCSAATSRACCRSYCSSRRAATGSGAEKSRGRVGRAVPRSRPLARSGRGDFLHPAPPLRWLVASRPTSGR